MWISQKSSDEERSVACLPDRLKAEIAIHVHLDTLKRVDIFQNTEAGFLCELVLRLKLVLFSPGDYVCRKNEVGHEMYIVSRGILEVVANEGKSVVATLKAGSYFGEISVLNVGLAGNKRTASVRSVGYSDLFCLNKQDLWDVLKNYPNAEARIRARAEERLSKLPQAVGGGCSGGNGSDPNDNNGAANGQQQLHLSASLGGHRQRLASSSSRHRLTAPAKRLQQPSQQQPPLHQHLNLGHNHNQVGPICCKWQSQFQLAHQRHYQYHRGGSYRTSGRSADLEQQQRPPGQACCAAAAATARWRPESSSLRRPKNLGAAAGHSHSCRPAEHYGAQVVGIPPSYAIFGGGGGGNGGSSGGHKSRARRSLNDRPAPPASSSALFVSANRQADSHFAHHPSLVSNSRSFDQGVAGAGGAQAAPASCKTMLAAAGRQQQRRLPQQQAVAAVAAATAATHPQSQPPRTPPRGE